MDVELPKLADTLVEGTVSRWLKQAGEAVRKGEPLVEIETDKVNSELEAPADGVLEILVAAGEKTLRDAKTIASWQSPTATLLGSSSDELLKSLPQLNQTVDELKSFLRDQPQ